MVRQDDGVGGKGVGVVVCSWGVSWWWADGGGGGRLG
jgi:hypothetical protein